MNPRCCQAECAHTHIHKHFKKDECDAIMCLAEQKKQLRSIEDDSLNSLSSVVNLLNSDLQWWRSIMSLLCAATERLMNMTPFQSDTNNWNELMKTVSAWFQTGVLSCVSGATGLQHKLSFILYKTWKLEPHCPAVITVGAGTTAKAWIAIKVGKCFCMNEDRLLNIV